MNAQSLDSASSVSRRIWSQTASRAAGGDRSAPAPCRPRSARCRPPRRSAARSRPPARRPTPCQSLPEPHELGGNSTGAPTNPASTASASVPTRTPASGSARSTRSSHAGPSCHQWPNSSVSNAATTCAGRPSRVALGRPAAARTTSTKSATWVSTAASARCGVVRRLVVGRHVASGHPGRLEAGVVVVGVEVPVVGVPGIARLRRPHPVADLQVAPERDDVRAVDRPAQRGVAVQRRAVDHEVLDARRRVVVPPCPGAYAHSGAQIPVGRVREALAGVGQPLAQRELPQPRVQQRLERVRQRPAEQLDRRPRRAVRAAAGWPPWRQRVSKSSSARSASSYSRAPNSPQAQTRERSRPRRAASSARSCQLASQ